MFSPKDAVTEIKSEMASLSQSGHAVRYRGIIVTPEVWKALEEDSDGFHGVMGVSGTEGNRWVRYTFYVLSDPSLEQAQKGLTHFFVHHPQDVYTEKFLGRLPQTMAEDRKKLTIGGWVIEDVNPIFGEVSTSSSNIGRNYVSADFDDVVKVSQAAFSAHEDIGKAVYRRFDRWYICHNPPEAKWLGELRFDKLGEIASANTSGLSPFRYRGEKLDTLVGRLLMRSKFESNGPFDIIGIARDGFDHVHLVNMQGTKKTDWMEFAKIAIKYFLPEEILLATGRRKLSDLEAIQAFQEKEHWGTMYDSEDVGRIHEFNSSGPYGKKSFVLSVDCVDTRGKEACVEFADIDQGEKTKWDNLRAKYFPSDWKEWPKTKQDRQFASFAATL